MIRWGLVVPFLTAHAVADDTYGAVAGVNMVEFSSAGIDNTRIKFRPTIGAFYRFQRTSVSIDLGLQYSWRRIDWTSCGVSNCDGVPGANDVEWTFHDLEIPVLVRLPLSHTTSFRASALAGAAPSLSLKKTESVEGFEPQPLMQISGKDLALLAGLGAELRRGALWFGFELRGSLGLTRRYDPGDGDATGTAYAAYALFTVAHVPAP